MSKEYVTQLDYEFNGEPRIAYRITGTRISLDSVIINWLNGETPESISQDFHPLPLEKIYGAIAFYLANREMIDEYLRQVATDFDKLREELREKNHLLYQKLAAHRQEKLSQAARPATEYVNRLVSIPQ
jgi:uncharacterized protein (DUF433 family)